LTSATYGPEVSEFLEQLRHAPSAALLLDFDGTLAPFQADRFQARPYPGVVPLLEKIAATGRTKLAIIGGRPVFELKSLLDPLQGVELWGAHGLERLFPDGRYGELAIDGESLELLWQAKEGIVAAHLLLLAEIKPGGIAMHWRGIPEDEARHAEATIREIWRPFVEMPRFRLLEFEQGLELRVAHPDKGDAVARIVEEGEPQLQVAYLGDDSTDEDAFRMLNGHGLTVLVRPEYRRTLAQTWLKPPEELTAFLEDWLQQTS
jgi:trehalose 6-phosphate phosphatase